MEDGDCGTVVHLDDLQSGFDYFNMCVTEITTQDHKSRTFLGEEKVNILRTRTNLNNKFNGPYDGHRFTACVSNIWYVVRFAALGFESFLEFIKSYETEAWSSIEDDDESFRSSDGLSNVSVNFVITISYDVDGLRFRLLYNSHSWSFQKANHAVGEGN